MSPGTASAATRSRSPCQFQRLGNNPNHGDARGNGRGVTGAGLLLAVALGFAWSMAGEIVVDDTPGGGTTMTVELEASR